jgi:SNF2 family DNA or RNA helicase
MCFHDVDDIRHANHVIMFDRWFNPAVESQAIDRAFRIGQMRNVFVHKMVCSATFEERIDEMIEAKRELTSLSVSTGERWISKMSDSELEDLFAISTDVGSVGG